MWILEMSLLMAAQNVMIPSLAVSYKPLEWMYIKQTSSSRCEPDNAVRLNPTTAQWGMALVFDIRNDINVEVGHLSSHTIEAYKLPVESIDYIRIGYKKEFK